MYAARTYFFRGPQGFRRHKPGGAKTLGPSGLLRDQTQKWLKF